MLTRKYQKILTRTNKAVGIHLDTAECKWFNVIGVL